MRYVIRHETALSFPKPVREHQCELRLVPREDEHQRVQRAALEVRPECKPGGYVDCFGNRVTTTSLVTPHDSLVVRLEAEVETLLANPFAFAALPPAREGEWIASAVRSDPRLLDFLLHRSPAVPELDTLPETIQGLPVKNVSAGVVEAMQELMTWAADTFRYEPGATGVHAPLSDFAEKSAGVCQDFAHLLVTVARHLGVPARYVMGYLDPGYAEREDGEDDPVPPSEPATHAWAEVLVPGAGWRGFDATHRLVVNDTYVAVAVGRDSRDAAPMRGSFKGEESGESPRVQLHVSRASQ